MNQIASDRARAELEFAVEHLKRILVEVREGGTDEAQIEEVLGRVREALRLQVHFDAGFSDYVERLRGWYEEVLRHRPNQDDGEYLSIEFVGGYHDHEGDGDGVVVAAIETKRYETGL